MHSNRTAPAMKYCLLLLLAFAVTGCSNYNRYIKAHELMNVDFERTYRDYALCKCLEYGYDNPAIFREDISRGVYMDITLHTLAFNGTDKKLDSVARSAADSIQPFQILDYEGKKAVMLHCIEFYNSAQLKKNVKEIIAVNAKRWDGK